MAFHTEIKFDFDRTVDTEARFAIRKITEQFIELLNSQQIELWSKLFSEALVVEGLSDLPEFKHGFVQSFKRKLQSGERKVRLPELKLLFDRAIYKLVGTYEEYAYGLLVKEGRITFELVNIEDSYQITKILFDPRMLVSEDI